MRAILLKKKKREKKQTRQTVYVLLVPLSLLFSFLSCKSISIDYFSLIRRIQVLYKTRIDCRNLVRDETDM